VSILTKQSFINISVNKIRCYIALLTLGCFIAAISVEANGSLGEINIKLSGTVVAQGCTIDPGDINKQIQLGEWATAQLKKKGQATSRVPFTIHLTGCTANGITTEFTGTKDNANPELLKLNSEGRDYAKGIAVQIMDGHGKRIPMGVMAPRGVVDDNGNITLNFQANYVATQDEGVNPGVANADTEFTLIYD